MRPGGGRVAWEYPVFLLAGRDGPRHGTMQLDDQLLRYFGTADLGALTPPALAAGIERMKVDLGLETDRGVRFALWALLFMLGNAPDLDATFEDAADREAARNFMDLSDSQD